MPYYVALIHKDSESCFGVSFPDLPGVFTAADTLDEVMRQAEEVLAFAAEDWDPLTGKPFPLPRTLDVLRQDQAFQEASTGAVVAVVPLRMMASSAA